MLNPFALPVHPAVVHFPLALLLVAWVCTIVRYVTGDLRWDDRGRLFEVVGVASLPFALGTAIIDTRGFGFLIHPRTDAPLIWHMTAGFVGACAFAGHYLWRRRRVASDISGRLALQDVSLMTFGVLALVAASLLGGELVFGA
jgi:uncharacterized membrane protein